MICGRVPLSGGAGLCPCTGVARQKSAQQWVSSASPTYTGWSAVPCFCQSHVVASFASRRAPGGGSWDSTQDSSETCVVASVSWAAGTIVLLPVAGSLSPISPAELTALGGP